MNSLLKYIIILTAHLVVGFCLSQKTTASGLKYGAFILGVEGGVSVPILSGFFNDKQNVPRGDEMSKKREWLDYNYQLTMAFSTLDRTAIGVSAGVFQYEVLPNQVYAKNYRRLGTNSVNDSIGIKLESASINQYFIIPTVEFYMKDGAVPVGFYHTLGAGWGFSKIRKGSYAYSINTTPENLLGDENWTAVDQYNFNDDWKGFNQLIIQYGIGLRVPILYENLVLGVSVLSSFNLAFSPNSDVLASSSDFFNYSDIYYNARRERLFSVTMNAGIFYTF